MPQYREHVLILRDCTDVFDFMDDIANEQLWQPGIREAQQDPPGAQKVGTKRRYVTSFLGKKFRNEYVNTAYERPRRVAYESTADSDLKARGDITIEPVAGGTLVTMMLEVENPRALKLLPRKTVEQASQKELAKSLTRLKEVLEGGA